MEPADRTLLVVRHAKSDWGTGLPDVERPLNKRGRRDAPAVGRWIADQAFPVDAAVVSPAERTRQTWSLLAASGELAVAPAFDRGIYLGEADELAEAVRCLEPSARCAVLVGHAPGCPDLVEWLTAGAGSAEALQRMRAKFPTSGVAAIALDGDWTDVEPASGVLLDFQVCRG